MITRKWLALVALSMWILMACHLASAPPTPQPTGLATPTSVSTLVVPATAEPALLNQYLQNARTIGIDTFDDPAAWNPGLEIANGQLLLAGLGGNVWHGLSNRLVFRTGQGAVIDFRFTPGEFFEMYFEQGPWNTALYKRFGLYVNGDHSNANLFAGRERTDFHVIAGTLSMVPGAWYSLLLALGSDGAFLAVIWDPAHPEQNLQYRQVIADWRAIDWTFRIQVNQGEIVFDDFEAIQFDGLR